MHYKTFFHNIEFQYSFEVIHQDNSLLLLLHTFITRYLHPSCLATLGMNLKREAVYD